MEFRKIILIFFGLLIIYLIYKTRNLEKLSEDLQNTNMLTTAANTSINTLIENTINSKYKTDMGSIVKLNNFINSILVEEGLYRMPTNNANFKDIVIIGSTTIKNLLNIEDLIDIVNIDSMLANLLPKYTIVEWFNSTIPLGWAICDGKSYSLNSTGTAIEDENGIVTPDLRGRFILGSGVGDLDENNKPLTARNLDAKGGTEKHQLTLEQMPRHNHKALLYHDNYQHRGAAYESNFKPSGWSGLWTSTAYKGGKLKTGSTTEYVTVPHNNMPPYNVLIHIMKL